MKQHIFILAALVGIILVTCTDKSPIDVETHELRLPENPALINRSVLGSDGDFMVGYTNGNIRSDRIFLNWQASSSPNFLAYKIFRDNSVLKTIADSSVTSLVDSSLSHNTFYLYKVAILVKEGTSLVDTLTIKTPQILPPNEIDFTILSDTCIHIFWTNRMESATEYEISRRQGFVGDFDTLATVPDTFFVDNTVQNNETYTYRIVAKNDFEESRSAQTNISVNYRLVTPILTSVIQLPGVRSIEINWNDDSNAENNFGIFRKTQGQNFVQIVTVPFNTTTYVDNDTINSLIIGETYTYRLNAFNASDTTDFSDSLSVTISDFAANINEGFESGALPANSVTGGNANWFVTSDNSYEGNYSARSGAITNNESTYLQINLNVTQMINISFYYHVSSESGYDFLRFFINGNVVDSWSGEVGWQIYQTNFNADGIVTLEWQYIKDSSQSSGQDAAWIDNIVVQ